MTIMTSNGAEVKQALLDIGSEWTGPTADVSSRRVYIPYNLHSDATLFSQKVLALYGESLQALKKLIGKTTVVKDVRYGQAERNVMDVSELTTLAKFRATTATGLPTNSSA